MEEPYDTPDPEFVKGFNEGYLLAKHLPDVAKQLDSLPLDTPRSTGFQAGRQQLALEQERARAPQWLRADFLDSKQNGPNPAPDRERDFDKER